MIVVKIQVPHVLSLLANSFMKLLIPFVLVCINIWISYAISCDELIYDTSLIYDVPVSRIYRLLHGARLLVTAALLANVYCSWWFAKYKLSKLITLISMSAMFIMVYCIIIAMNLLFSEDLVDPASITTPDSTLLFENYRRVIHA